MSIQPEDILVDPTKIEEIAFSSDNPLESIPELITAFKNDLLRIGKKFCFHENKPHFAELRPLYASALRTMLLADDPSQNDPTFQELSKHNIGIEHVYYNQLKLKRMILALHEEFFVDFRHPHLYDSMDRHDHRSFSEAMGKYGFIKISVQYNDAFKTSKETLPEEASFMKNFETSEDAEDQSWVSEYEERLPRLYGYTAREIAWKANADLAKKMEELKM